jgi:pyruvate dehydrogenase E2 component (dihydrolipoamide acetyltransferase)
MQKTRHHRTSKLVATAATAAIAAAMIAVGAPSASAANQIINTSGDTFTPSALTAVVNVGDTVTFNGLGGHNATSTAASVAKFASPAGAASFVYKTTTPGKHTYDCTFHSGMVGSFTVVGAAAPAAPAPKAPAAPGPIAAVPAAPAAPAAPAPAAPAPGTDPAAAGGQVSTVPQGGIASGGGSTAQMNDAGLKTLGGGLLMAAFMSALLGRRVARRS